MTKPRMPKVIRLQGKTYVNTYVVSVFVDEGKISRIEINGHHHESVTEICDMFARAHTKLICSAVKCIKLTMAKRGEYKGEVVF